MREGSQTFQYLTTFQFDNEPEEQNCDLNKIKNKNFDFGNIIEDSQIF